ncbi:MAG TPA: hypothetical protein VFX12_14975 [Vicinamibacterales bacterium]|nr:hypothetical protein [Vicinamibacterales bacterium]
MTRRTHYFMAGSVAVLVAGLGVGLAAYYGGGFPSLSASRTGPSELSYVPADASVVAFANVRQVMDSQLRQKIRQAVPQHDQGQKEFQQATGIDIEHDIDYVVAAVTSSAPDDASGLVVARGRFNDAQLEGFAHDHGGVTEEYRGKRLVSVSDVHMHHPGMSESPDASHGNHRITLAFLEPGLVGIGSERAIRSSIDAEMSAHSITSNGDIMDLVSDIERGNTCWAVGRFDAIANRARLPEQVSREIPDIKTFAVMSHIDGGISGTLRAVAKDEKAAENLRDVVRGFLALGRMQAQSDPKLNAMLQSLQLAGTGTTVSLSFSVPADVFNGLPHMNGQPGDAPRPPQPPSPPRPPRPDR